MTEVSVGDCRCLRWLTCLTCLQVTEVSEVSLGEWGV